MLIFLTKISTPASLPLISLDVQVALQSPFSPITRIAIPPSATLCTGATEDTYSLSQVFYYATALIKCSNYTFEYIIKFPLCQSFFKNGQDKLINCYFK